MWSVPGIYTEAAEASLIEYKVRHSASSLLGDLVFCIPPSQYMQSGRVLPDLVACWSGSQGWELSEVGQAFLENTLIAGRWWKKEQTGQTNRN